MTYDVFFWYVFPFVVGIAAFGWIAYDKRKTRHPHPGE